jgi:hypothetical protein
MPQAEPIGSVGDGRDGTSRRSGNLQQQLMLLWLQTGAVRCLLAELHEGPEAVAKFSQPLDQLRLGGVPIFHEYIVSRHIKLAARADAPAARVAGFAPLSLTVEVGGDIRC